MQRRGQPGERVIEADGYSVHKRLASSSRAEVHAAERSSDHKRVVLKRYAQDAEADGRTRAARELESLRKAQGPGVPVVLELIADAQPPILVIEQVPGISLHSWVVGHAPPLEARLDVGRQLAALLGRIHDVRLIHRDLGPGNILVDPVSLATHLIDFGAALPFGTSQRGGLSLSRSREVAGQLAYIAPEQTGRMGRGIDTRSDLYSLGATLYFALTGRPPFDSSDPLALIHAHLARVPEPPRQVASALPITVSRIVLKLLEKEPEQRYQTGHALAHDLDQCLELLRRGERIPDDLELGTADAPTRPIFRNRIYGRDAELAALLASYERARAGRSEIVLLQGSPGSGKSSLVDALRPSVAASGGYVAAGKFDLYHGEGPYGGMQRALGALVDQLLCESEERLGEWRTRLRAALGSLAGVVLELVPDLAPVLGNADAPASLAAKEASHRLAFGVERLLHACARPEHPLVLVLDDLQWAERESLALLEHVFATTRDAALLIVGCHRSDAPESIESMRSSVARCGEHAPPLVEIEIGPLTRDAAAELVADALAQPIDRTRGLAELILVRTDRTPLLIRELILHLHAVGHIRAEPPIGWSWDEAAIASAELPAGTVEILVAKLASLPLELRGTLELLSCVGDEFDLGSLAALSERPQHELDDHLFALADAGLLTPSSCGLRFAHDRIREAAQGGLDDARRAEIHHRIGERLLAQLAPEELSARALEVAEHLLRGASRLTSDRREIALRIHTLAAQHALAAGLANTAATHFRRARELFREEDWKADADGAFALLHDSVEAALQIDAHEEALEIAEGLRTRPLSPDHAHRATLKLIRVLIRVDAERAVDLALETLHEHGIRWSRKTSRLRTRLELHWLDWCLRGPLDERAFGPPHDDVARWMRVVALLNESNPALMRTQTQLIVLSITRSLHVLRRHGAIHSPALLLAALAPARIEVLGHWRGVERYADAAMAWVARRQDPINPRARCSLEVFTLPWLRPRRAIATSLVESAAALEESGDAPFAALATQNRLCALALAGTPLRELERHLHAAGRTERLMGMRSFLTLMNEVLALLQNERPETIDWPALHVRVEPTLRGSFLLGRIHWMHALLLMGDIDRVSAEVERTSAIEAARAPLAAPELWLLRGLVAARRSETAARRERWRLRRRARRCARWLAERGRQNPDHAALAALLDAEIARSSRAPAVALHQYARAAELASDRQLPQHAALMHERRASLLAERQRSFEASSCLQQAIDLYGQWGADAKVSMLERELTTLQDTVQSSRPRRRRTRRADSR
jgi:serine/threonine protein kinase